MLELLRSRLTDLEARQRAAGGVAEHGFWDSLTAGMPSAPSEPTAGSAFGEGAPGSTWGTGASQQATSQQATSQQATGNQATGKQAPGWGASTRSAGMGRRARRTAPEMRPPATPSGPWAFELRERAASPDGLASLDAIDLDQPRWLDQSGLEQGTTDDPAWVEAACARHEARERQDAARGVDQGAVDAVTIEAMAGFGLTGHAGAELTAAAEQIAALRRTHEVTLVTILTELVARGIDAPDGLSRTDWLRRHDPTLTAGQAKAFVTVGTALTEARWARLRLLVATQQITVGNAAQIIDFHTRNQPVADPDDLHTALGDLTAQAPQLRPEELACLARHHTEQIRPPHDDHDDDRRDQKRRDARGLWFTHPTATGMVGMRATLDPEAAAILKAAIDPLAAPDPVHDEACRTVARDSRAPARRRLDALLAIVQRGVASAGHLPTTDKAKIVVLIDHDALLHDLDDDQASGRGRGGTGRGGATGRGSGTTLTGDVLSPGVVRRMACDAEIIPVVLGGHSEPLDVGRSRRLFTRAQRLALITRDKGCSYPDCTVPATWCDAHHVVHWRHGGPTDLTNAALLCPRHHTTVHERDLTATVTALGVTWHT